MTMTPCYDLETRFFEEHGHALAIDGMRILVPTLSRERLVSLLVSSRALHTETVEATVREGRGLSAHGSMVGSHAPAGWTKCLGSILQESDKQCRHPAQY